MRLSEGLRAGDLEDMVLPMISVDEYESKIDASVLVIAFYAAEQDAADDLNRFIQRSPVNVIDTDISPAPDAHGFFLVFVEMARNDKTPEALMRLIEEVSGLTRIDRWDMHVRKVKKLVPLTLKTLSKALTLTGADLEREEARNEQRVLEALRASDLRTATFEEGRLVLQGARHTLVFEQAKIAESSEISGTFDLRPAALAKAHMIESVLGHGWTAQVLNRNVIVSNSNTQDLLILCDF